MLQTRRIPPDRRLRLLPGISGLLVAWLLLPSPARAQSAANVLVVANGRLPSSLALADYYATRRGIPAEQLLRLSLEPDDEIDRSVYEREIEAPIAAWLGSHGARDRILYVVLVKGVPLRIAGSAGRDGTAASVDSELTLLYRRMTGAVVPLTGRVPNPYYLGERVPAAGGLFSRRAMDVYLVTRLDGFDDEGVRGLIDRGAAPSNEGIVLLDQKPPLEEPGANAWMKEANRRLAIAGFADRVLLEATSRPAGGESHAIGYASWGSNDPASSERVPSLRFVPGALAVQFVSTDARTFTPPPAAWKPGAWGDRTRYYEGSPQSLAGDLVRAGVTGIGAQVAEPYLDGIIRPDILFPAYFAGYNLAEAFYLATPYLSWQTVVVGDPLCTPFERRPLAPGDVEAGIEPGTETPAFFASRRLAVLEERGAAPAAARALLRAEARLARKDAEAARRALEEATAADPGLREAQVLLAEQYQQAGEPHRAAERYRAVLDRNPKDGAVLNNLAYLLAVDLKQPQEALSYAERAFTLAPGSAEVADTYGWTLHLLGRDREAMTVLAKAARLAPANGVVRLHAAVAYARNGMVDAARRELEEAVRLDPAVAGHEEALALRSSLK